MTDGKGMVVIRNRANYYSGWGIAVGLLVVTVSIDAMHLYSRWPDAPDETPLQALPSHLAFAVMGLGAFARFSRPRVEVTAGDVVLRNVFQDVFIPASAIETLDDSGGYLVVTAAGRDFTAVATEASNLTMFLGRQGTAQALRSALSEVSDREPDDGAVRVAVRESPTGSELVLWVAYALYPAAALLRPVFS